MVIPLWIHLRTPHFCTLQSNTGVGPMVGNRLPLAQRQAHSGSEPADKSIFFAYAF